METEEVLKLKKQLIKISHNAMILEDNFHKMKKFIPFFENKLSEVYSEKQRLEKIILNLGNSEEDIIKNGEIQSKLFWLGKLSGKIKDDMDEYKALTEHISTIKI